MKHTEISLAVNGGSQDLVANLKQLANIHYPPRDMSERGQAAEMDRARKIVREYLDEVRRQWWMGKLK